MARYDKDNCQILAKCFKFYLNHEIPISKSAFEENPRICQDSSPPVEDEIKTIIKSLKNNNKNKNNQQQNIGPSSTQNSSESDKDPPTEKSSENEADLETSKDVNSDQMPESNSLTPEVELTEENVVTAKEEHSNTSNGKNTAISSEKVLESTPKLPVVLTYAARQRPKQPFFSNANQSTPSNPPHNVPRLPAPPSYYVNYANQNQPINRQPEPTPPPQNSRPDNPNRYASPNEYQYNQPHFYQVGGGLALFPNILVNAAYWAPYPTKIPSNTPACLAHLVEAEVLFIIQKVDIIELMAGVGEPNTYLIQNKNGECLYYAYETTDICGAACCAHARGFQLHILDMYQNEVIYMNRPCGCTFLFCCYPVMEVYAPPTVPVGAVTKVCHPYREEFIIIDPDENIMFRIHGNCTLKHCCPCFEFNFSIHALDTNETVVGHIRREFGGYIRTLFTSADFYGISFPMSLDVRVKAIFLGALFLIDMMYFESNDPCCSCFL